MRFKPRGSRGRRVGFRGRGVVSLETQKGSPGLSEGATGNGPAPEAWPGVDAGVAGGWGWGTEEEEPSSNSSGEVPPTRLDQACIFHRIDPASFKKGVRYQHRRYHWLRPIAFGPNELPGDQAGAAQPLSSGATPPWSPAPRRFWVLSQWGWAPRAARRAPRARAGAHARLL